MLDFSSLAWFAGVHLLTSCPRPPGSESHRNFSNPKRLQPFGPQPTSKTSPQKFSPSVQTYRLLLFCGCIFSTYKIGRWDGPNPKSRRGFWSFVLGRNILAPTLFERLTQMQSNIPMWQFKPNFRSIYSLSPQGSEYKMLLKIYIQFLKQTSNTSSSPPKRPNIASPCTSSQDKAPPFPLPLPLLSPFVFLITLAIGDKKTLFSSNPKVIVSSKLHKKKKLVGGFNPCEKYESKWVQFPQIGAKIKKNWKPPPGKPCD